MISNLKNLGSTIKTLRTVAGYSQKEFAESIGISASGLSLIEKNLRDPSLSILKSISNSLKIPVSVIITASDQIPLDLDDKQREIYIKSQQLLTDSMILMIQLNQANS